MVKKYKWNVTKKFPYPVNLLRDIQECLRQEPLVSYSDTVKDNLISIIKTRSEKDQELLRMRYEEGRTLSEIGEYYGITGQGVQKKLFRLVRDLGKTQYREKIFHIPKTPEEIYGIEDLELSNHACNVLLRNRIETLEQLKDLGCEGIAGLRSVGKTTLDEIMDKAGFLWKDIHEGYMKAADSSG